jgi:uncharacterized membrane-anchored protein
MIATSHLGRMLRSYQAQRQMLGGVALLIISAFLAFSFICSEAMIGRLLSLSAQTTGTNLPSHHGSVIFLALLAGCALVSLLMIWLGH